jgi:delta 1-pyrroline-5-carboxylate dehydrogenase
MMGHSPLDGYDLSKGSFYPPTVITDVNLQDELWSEEIFGPVVVVQKFRVGNRRSFIMEIFTTSPRVTKSAFSSQMIADMVSGPLSGHLIYPRRTQSRQPWKLA